MKKKVSPCCKSALYNEEGVYYFLTEVSTGEKWVGCPRCEKPIELYKPILFTKVDPNSLPEPKWGNQKKELNKFLNSLMSEREFKILELSSACPLEIAKEEVYDLINNEWFLTEYQNSINRDVTIIQFQRFIQCKH